MLELLPAVTWFGRTFVTEGTIVMAFIAAGIGSMTLLWTKIIAPAYRGIQAARQWLQDVHEVVTRELVEDGNGGHSTKDKVNKTWDSLQETKLELVQANAELRRVEQVAGEERHKLQETLDNHIDNAELHHQLVAHESRQDEQS